MNWPNGLFDFGDIDGKFFEPGGVHFANGSLYIADTNQHRIMVYEFSRNQSRELSLSL